MNDFFTALSNPDIPFLRYALIAGLLASVAFGITGAFVVARRISYIAGAISHSVLGGIGAGLFLQHYYHLSLNLPMYGGAAAAAASAVAIGLVSRHARQREDTVIGAIWSIGMAAGLLFIARTPGYIDPMSYLFGNILLISKADLWLIASLDIIIVGTSIYFFKNLQAVCFDEEYAKLRGINVGLYYMLLLMMTAMTVVLLVRVVGIVLVIALLTIPPAVAEHFSRRMSQMMLLAVAFCALFIVSGIALSYIFDLPSGPSIIIFAGMIYVIFIILRIRKNRR